MGSGLMDKRAVGDRIIKRKPRFQMQSGRREIAGKHQGSTGGGVTQNEPGGIVALPAQTQQILVPALRQLDFAAVQGIAEVCNWKLKELRGGTQVLPHLSCAG